MSPEKGKMLAGQLYQAGDPLLRRERRHARKILRAYNDSCPDEPEERARILKELFAAVGAEAEIEPHFHCDYGYNIRVGHRFYANFNCVILDCAPVTVGDNVFLGPAVQIYTATHPLAAAERERGLEMALPVTIGDGVWIGGGAIINPGITIGRGTTIGSGSVVTRDMPPNVLAAGNPCKVLRSLA